MPATISESLPLRCAECRGRLDEDDVTWVRFGYASAARLVPLCVDCAAEEEKNECGWCGEPCDGRWCSPQCRAAEESDYA